MAGFRISELLKPFNIKNSDPVSPFTDSDKLEPRRLLAITASFSGGVLTVRGDTAANNIFISENGTAAEVYGDATLLPIAGGPATLGAIQGIKIYADNGNDVINLNEVTKAKFSGLTDPSSATSNADILIDGGDGGTTDSDLIFGSEFGETIESSTGHDTINANAGHDYVNADFRSDVDGGSGNDVIFGGWDVNELAGGSGNDSIVGGNKTDQIWGDDGADTLKGGSGNDSVWGGNWGDQIYGGSGRDSLYGGDNPDWIDGGNHDDLIWGGNHSDVIYGSSGDDAIDGGNASDLIAGQAGNDDINGGNGDDRIYGGNDQDVITGANGSDILYGGNQNDQIHGGVGHDYLYGGNHNDSLYDNARGTDSDSLHADSDRLYGGAGIDELDAVDGDTADIIDPGEFSGQQPQNNDARIDSIHAYWPNGSGGRYSDKVYYPDDVDITKSFQNWNGLLPNTRTPDEANEENVPL